MKMVRYNPNQLLDELQKEFFPWAGAQDKSFVETSEWVPRIDIAETADKFIVLADVPGVNPKDIDISMENHVLTLKGRRESVSETKELNLTRIERSAGSFYRQFTLPDTAAAELITAKSKHGVLEITIPKQEVAKARTIQVDIEE